MYEHIPAELKALPQWVCARNKIPFNPAGSSASVTDPTTWSTFEQAVAAVKKGVFEDIGFVFTKEDPYVFIDLDAPKENGVIISADDPRAVDLDAKHQSWIKGFSSYTELSKSRRGYHIICKGSIPQAVKAKGYEIYDSKRYAIFTGEVVLLTPVLDRQKELKDVLDSMRIMQHSEKKPVVVLQDDQAILSRIAAASNANAIRELWEGKWQTTYPSQSEADFALLSHLAFYTQDDQQAMRLFRLSKLAERPKAKRDDYILNSIRSIRAAVPPPVDLTNFTPTLPPKKAVAALPYPEPPDGLKDIANFIFGRAIQPVKEIAWAGAIAFAAGIAGRHFNISGTGLNQYILLLAGTGLGKEGAADGIDALYDAIRPRIPEIENFRGPSNFASGQGLFRSFTDKTIPSMLCVIGEFGLRLNALSHPQANSSEIFLRAALLDFFSKSGRGNMISPVAYSDSTKNTTLLEAPALSIMGVSTPETFFAKLTDASICDGLIPRFLTINYDGALKVSSKARIFDIQPALLDHLCTFVELCIYMSRNNSYATVATENAAQALFDAYEVTVVAQMSAYPDGAIRNILNRAHLKALRLAGLAAVVKNPKAPSVSGPIAQWAIDFVRADCSHMLSRFEVGAIGDGDNRQLHVLREKIRQVMQNPEKITNETYKAMIDQGVMPHSLISQKLLSSACFDQDKRGASAALKSSLQIMIDCGELRELSKTQTESDFKTSMRCYQVRYL